jgi:FkbM family methyltransferase
MEQLNLRFSLFLERLSVTMRGLGLQPVARIGKHLVKLLLREGICVNVDGFRMSAAVEQNGYLHAWRKGLVEPFMAELLRSLVKPGMVVLDLGANLGYYTLVAARQVGTNGKVYAFEPDPRNYAHLVRNIKRNGFDDRIIAASKAVSDTTGMAIFLLNATKLTNSSMFLSPGRVKRVSVECIAIDNFLEEGVVVDVIKMHIEGAELHALRGMERTLARASNDLTMFVAVQPEQLRAAGGSAQLLVEQLQALGLTVMFIDEQNHCLAPIDFDIEAVKFVNLFCSRGKKTPWQEQVLEKCQLPRRGF